MTSLSKIEVEQVVRSYNPQRGEVQSVRKVPFAIPVANSWRRYIHAIIDLALSVFIFSFVIEMLGFGYLKEWEWVLRCGSYYLFYLPYCLIMETLFGQTLGKMIMGNVVITDYAEKPTFVVVAIRTSIRMIPFFPMSLLWLETPYHDIWSKTYVVPKKEVERLKEMVNK